MRTSFSTFASDRPLISCSCCEDAHNCEVPHRSARVHKAFRQHTCQALTFLVYMIMPLHV